MAKQQTTKHQFYACFELETPVPFVKGYDTDDYYFCSHSSGGGVSVTIFCTQGEIKPPWLVYAIVHKGNNEFYNNIKKEKAGVKRNFIGAITEEARSLNVLINAPFSGLLLTTTAKKNNKNNNENDLIDSNNIVASATTGNHNNNNNNNNNNNKQQPQTQQSQSQQQQQQTTRSRSASGVSLKSGVSSLEDHQQSLQQYQQLYNSGNANNLGIAAEDFFDGGSSFNSSVFNGATGATGGVIPAMTTASNNNNGGYNYNNSFNGANLGSYLVSTEALPERQVCIFYLHNKVKLIVLEYEVGMTIRELKFAIARKLQATDEDCKFALVEVSKFGLYELCSSSNSISKFSSSDKLLREDELVSKEIQTTAETRGESYYVYKIMNSETQLRYGSLSPTMQGVIKSSNRNSVSSAKQRWLIIDAISLVFFSASKKEKNSNTPPPDATPVMVIPLPEVISCGFVRNDAKQLAIQITLRKPTTTLNGNSNSSTTNSNSNSNSTSNSNSSTNPTSSTLSSSSSSSTTSSTTTSTNSSSITKSFFLSSNNNNSTSSSSSSKSSAIYIHSVGRDHTSLMLWMEKIAQVVSDYKKTSTTT